MIPCRSASGILVEDAPIVVEKERFSFGAYLGGKLLVFKAKKENRNGKTVPESREEGESEWL